jgi:hypothetical protein
MSTKKPNADLKEVEKQCDAFNASIEEMTMDRLKSVPKQDTEAQTLLSQKELEKKKDIYLKPHRTIGCRNKFNEKFRDRYNFDKEYVQFIAENREIIGEEIDMWTKPYAGVPAEEWKVPVNKPVWGPRYLAEQIKRKCYHRFVMQDGVSTGLDGNGRYYGAMAVDTTIQRLDALPVSTRKSIFMGSHAFG